MERFKATGIETILGQRIKDIPDWFQNDGTEFSITLADGREVKTDLVVCITSDFLNSAVLNNIPLDPLYRVYCPLERSAAVPVTVVSRSGNQIRQG